MDTTPTPDRPRYRRSWPRLLLLILAPLVTLGIALWLLSPAITPAHDDHEHAAGTYYTCPMHPEIVRDAPGTCPICGMALVARQATPAAEDPHAAHGTTEAMERLTLSPNQRLLANVQTVPVGQRSLAPEVSVVGRIAFAEDRARTVSATVSGRVEALAVTFTGQPIRAGEPLLRLYSPELLAAQQEYLAARQGLAALEGSTQQVARDHAAALVEGAEQRLRLLGLTAAQVRSIAAGEAVGTSTVVTAPYSGTVLRKAVEVGQYVGQGQPLLWVVPLDPVWVVADVYEQDLASVRVGSTLTFTTPAAPDQDFAARVDFIDPVVDPATRTARVRATVRNESGVLRPGLFVRARVQSDAEAPADAPLAVPATAVLERGTRAVVWVEVEPGAFEPRDVRLGARADGWVAVTSGLVAGERVAVTGTFLLDSEAQLRSGAAASMSGHDH